MSKVGAASAFALALTVAGYREAAAATYYVAPGGDDANPGTITQPWRTFQKAASTLVAGDAVYGRAGTYGERIIPLNSGAAGQIITYAAYAGETVTIDGQGLTVAVDEGVIHLQSLQYIRISGFRVVNSGHAGILVDGSSHVTIDRNSTSATTSSGIGIWNSTDVVVDANRIEEACSSGMQECLTVGNSTSFEVRNNQVLNCHKEGITLKDGSANGSAHGNDVQSADAVGLYVDAAARYTHDIEVHSNTVHDSFGDGISIASEVGGLLQNVRVYNNVVYRNSFVGIVVLDCCPESTTHPVQGLTIVNNTVVRNGVTWGGGITVDNPDARSVVVRNNILSQNLSFQLAVAPAAVGNVSADHNLIDGFRGGENETYGDAAVIGDPLFVSPLTGNFRLQRGSPALRAGFRAEAPRR